MKAVFEKGFAILGILLFLFLVFPVFKMVFSLDIPTARKVLADAEVIQSIFLTLRCAMWATILALVTGIPLAYLLAKKTFPFQSIVQGMVDLPVVVPHTAAGIALLMVFGRRFLGGEFFSLFGVSFVGTEAGITVAMMFVSAPFLINAAKDAFSAVPDRMEAVARTLGATPAQVFFRLSLPLALRGIVSGALLMWARGISEFGAIIILAYHPMVTPVLIFERFEAYGLKLAYPVAALLVLVCLVLFSLFRFIASRKGKKGD
jgi:molybdate/tungstate transport system permease protein